MEEGIEYLREVSYSTWERGSNGVRESGLLDLSLYYIGGVSEHYNGVRKLQEGGVGVGVMG